MPNLASHLSNIRPRSRGLNPTIPAFMFSAIVRFCEVLTRLLFRDTCAARAGNGPFLSK